jgi:hypothetical protein
MFSEITKLLDRNFFVGFLLPVVLFILINLNFIPISQINAKFLPSLSENIFIGTTLIGFLGLVFSFVLQILNRYIYRILEGYGDFNPLKLFKYFERRRYSKLVKEIDKLDQEYELNKSQGIEFPQESRRIRITKKRDLVDRFPDEEVWILPTSFGNAIRAFEIYPRIMYGIDSIPGWLRLLGVISKDYREFVDAAKAQTDFWLNLLFLAVIGFFECLYISIISCNNHLVLHMIVAVVLIYVFYSQAVNSAIGWGSYIKAAFDIFLPELYEKLGLPRPLNRQKERENLSRFSQAVIYRNSSSLLNRSVSKAKK